MNPKVSILVPVYGVEAFIERCAVSLFEQTYDDIEYVFVNDCTFDNSIEILTNTIDRYPSRKNQIRLIHHSKNKGIGATRNTLLDNSIGEYLLYVDSDDFLDINAVQMLYNKAEQNGADIVVCDIWIEWLNSREQSMQQVGNCKRDFLQLLLSTRTMIGLPNKLIRRSLLVENHIRINDGLNYGEDFLVISKSVYYASGIAKVDMPLYHYSQTNPESYTSQKLSKSNIDNIIFVLNDLTSFFSQRLDGSIYNNALLEGKLRKKMDMLFYADQKYIKELIDLFPETNDIKDLSFLLRRDKFSYKLLFMHQIKMFYFYRYIYKGVFNLKRLLTNKK